MGVVFLDILKYWEMCELLSPVTQRSIKDLNILKDKEPWNEFKSETKKDKKLSGYSIFIGGISIDEVNDLLREVEENGTGEFKDKTVENALICRLSVSDKGIYTKTSLVISDYAYAVPFVLKYGLDADVNVDRIKEIERDFEEWIFAQDVLNEPLSTKGLKEIRNYLTKKLGIDESYSKEILYWKAELEGENKSSGIIPNQLLKDIRNIREGNVIESRRLKQYKEALLSNNENTDKRKFIVSDVDEIKKCLAAKNYPLGSWPSSYYPSLMQQIAINLMTHGEQDIFSVNGPPGTGKTTLVKEIVASNIVESALVMAEYESPDLAFAKKEFGKPLNGENVFYKLDEKLSRFGIIVASNNNVAVENISKDLPKRISADRSGMFSDPDNPDIYFESYAKELVGEEDAWGLVSARLGKKENIIKFCDVIQGNRNGLSQSILDLTSSIEEYKSAVESFLKVKAQVDKKREQIKRAQELVEEVQKIQNVIHSLEQAIEQDKRRKAGLLEGKSNFIKEKNRLEIALENTELELRDIEDIPFFQALVRKIKGLFVVDPNKDRVETLRCQSNQYKRDLELLGVSIERIEEDYTACVASISGRENQKEQEEHRFDSLSKELEDSRAWFIDVNSDGTSVDHFPNASYWQGIESNSKSQELCPWVSLQYNTLREQLFFYALQVHKHFFLNSECAKRNIDLLLGVWQGKIESKYRLKIFTDLLNTLLLVIPVISTTFAAASSLLDGVGPDSLGMAVIDEAGQANPQSAVGIINRCRKVLVVGDPLQIEPIDSVPNAIKDSLKRSTGVPSEYLEEGISVQRFADSLNQYGNYRGTKEQKLWVGCPLVVHRRCLDPMFSISNTVAYNDGMINKTLSPKASVLDRMCFEKSLWFDVPGTMKEKGKQSIESQNILAAKIFKKAISLAFDPVGEGAMPDIFFISPFRDVALNIQGLLKEVARDMDVKVEEEWIKDHCGTVHTFQGKEASEVVLVLGCDKNLGRGAAAWVGSKPNMINVAASRAKYRLYVIGEKALWREVKYVKVALEMLPVVTEQELDSTVSMSLVK